MTAAWLERLPVDDITIQAREIHPARTILTWVAGLLFAVGWLAYKTLAVAWLVGAWMFVAARTGWRDAKAGHEAARKVARGGPGRPG